MPKISIVVPLYNYENYIDDSVRSCLAQTFTDFEVVIVDDCSTDGSYAKAQAWTEKDERVRLVQQPDNKMLASTKNMGILESKGEFIVHLDADDMLTPNSLAIRLAEFDANPEAMMVHGRAYNFKGDNGYDWCLSNESKLTVDFKTQIHAQGAMLRRECYDKYGLYDESLLTNSDKEMWIRLRDLIGINMVASLEPVAFYRIHVHSMMVKRKMNKSYDQKVKKLLKNAVNMRKKEGITTNNTRFP